MTMKKKILTTLSVVLILGLAALGILAYLQSEDSDVNVMTLGNVSIDQIEQEWKDGSLVDFTQAKPLYPYVGNIAWEDRDADNGGAYRTFAMNNVVDKYVSVKNTGKSDAYVRTFIALEMGDYSYDEFNMVGISNNAENGSEFKFPGAWQWTDDFVANIDGKNYNVMVAVHKNPVKPGETTIPSLLQVYLSKDATNETVEKLDGNGNGTYEILAFSEAVQANGFDNAVAALNTAFGDTANGYHPWVDGVKIPVAVATADELSAALTAGEDVYLTEGVTVSSTMTVPANENVKIDLNGNNLSYAVSNSGASAIINNKGSLEIEGKGTISFTANNPDLGTIPAYATNTITNTGRLVIGEGVKVTNGSEGGASYAVDNHGEFVLNGGTLIGDRCALRVAKYNQDNVKFVMNSGVIEAKTPAWIQLPGSDSTVAPKISVTINGGTFKSTKAASADNDVLYTYSYGNSHANTSITINGGEFLGGTVSIGSGYKGDVPTLKINGGTFEYDVLQWLADGGSKVLY